MPGLLTRLLRGVAPCPTASFRDTPTASASASHALAPCATAIRSVPRESLDGPENLPEEGPRQAALSQLQDEEPRVPDEAAAGLEESLLEARQGPALDGTG